jgi:ankyrin repeat protein
MEEIQHFSVCYRIKKQPIGFTPLHLAALYGRKHVARLLLRKGANIEAKAACKCEATPYQCAHDDVAVFLHQNGAEVKKRSSTCECKPCTNLHIAVENGNVDVAKGPDCQWTPLHHAVVEGNFFKVELLLDNGADIEAKTACRCEVNSVGCLPSFPCSRRRPTNSLHLADAQTNNSHCLCLFPQFCHKSYGSNASK